jgi:hypothetical protein
MLLCRVACVANLALRVAQLPLSLLSMLSLQLLLLSHLTAAATSTATYVTLLLQLQPLPSTESVHLFALLDKLYVVYNAVLTTLSYTPIM